MKIFSNKFSLHLQKQPINSHFGFECRELSEVVSHLNENGADFPGQTFFARGALNPGFEQQIFDLHTHSKTSSLEVELVLCFDSEAEIREFWKSYANRFKEKAAAGGCVLNEKKQLLLIERNGLWDLPKGKIEKGEKNDEAAIREVEEETGIKNPVILKEMEVSWHIFSHNEKWILKPTYWYLMDYQGSDELIPQGEEGITQVIWKDPAALVQDMPDTYPIIQGLIRQTQESLFD